MDLKGKIINFLGDSITAGYGASCEEKRFTNIIEKRCGLKKANNYGICGTRFAYQSIPSDMPEYDLDFCMRAELMDDSADITVVFGATNDYGHGDAPIGRFGDTEKDTFYGACSKLMTVLITKYPGKPIVFATPLHREDEDRPDGSSLKQYVDIIKETAAFYSLPVLDLFAESGLQPRVPIIKEKFCPDGLHPNDAGHEILADKIIKYLSAL